MRKLPAPQPPALEILETLETLLGMTAAENKVKKNIILKNKIEVDIENTLPSGIAVSKYIFTMKRIERVTTPCCASIGVSKIEPNSKSFPCLWSIKGEEFSIQSHISGFSSQVSGLWFLAALIGNGLSSINIQTVSSEIDPSGSVS
jgi:hypothetical protein